MRAKNFKFFANSLCVASSLLGRDDVTAATASSTVSTRFSTTRNAAIRNAAPGESTDDETLCGKG